MSLNIKRFEDDLNALVAKSGQLEITMVAATLSKNDAKAALIKGGWTEEEADKVVAGKLSFKPTYEAWYSEALALLKQLLPDRVADFVGHYEVPRGRKEILPSNYKMQDYLRGTTITRYDGRLVAGPEHAISEFQSQAAILQAAHHRFRSSLFEIRQLVQADLFDSEIDAGRELAKNRFLRAAGAIAGVVLEKHLRQVCDDHGVKVTKKNPGIGDLNELLKANGVIDVPQWRHISLLGDIRNLCDHNKQKEPTAAQVDDLLDGTDKVIKTIS